MFGRSQEFGATAGTSRPRAHKFVALLSAAALLCASMPATAQETAPPPANGELPPGEVFGDWIVRCENAKTGEKVCHMAQELGVEGAKRPILSVAIGKPAGFDTFVMVLIAPLGIFLPAGAAMKVDENEQITTKFVICDKIGCRAEVPLDADKVAQMKAGAKALVAFQDGNRRQVNVPVSLTGFTAAFDKLQ